LLDAFSYRSYLVSNRMGRWPWIIKR